MSVTWTSARFCDRAKVGPFVLLAYDQQCSIGTTEESFSFVAATDRAAARRAAITALRALCADVLTQTED